ncbi:hypothetical protein KME66_20435 [Streptomyces sp. YPW6]|uniref:zinc finger domain-containing protein n=1 Tax=Streptomyces sp. YPW6 TaxID=2840373 RepID=UPI001C0C0AD2|nr:hypothetical protein [Streptomyces sp. YPW6]QWQ43081.1 hypothetical protein KME66_20435 [Streptomyces sp. YPW6]
MNTQPDQCRTAESACGRQCLDLAGHDGDHTYERARTVPQLADIQPAEPPLLDPFTEAAVRRGALLGGADAIEALPQDHECDPGRGDAVKLLRRLAGLTTTTEQPTGLTWEARADHAVRLYATTAIELEDARRENGRLRERLAELEQGQADADHLAAEHPDTITALVDEIADDIPHRRAPQIAADYLNRHARLLAEQITALGQARGWSTWAAALIHPDREFVDPGEDDDQAAAEQRDNLDFNRGDTVAAVRDALLDPAEHTPETALAASRVLLAAHTRLLADEASERLTDRDAEMRADRYRGRVAWCSGMREVVKLLGGRAAALAPEPAPQPDAAEEQPLAFPQLAVPCPRCKAPARQLCTSHNGTRTRTNDTHQYRTRAYRDQQAGR